MIPDAKTPDQIDADLAVLGLTRHTAGAIVLVMRTPTAKTFKAHAPELPEPLETPSRMVVFNSGRDRMTKPEEDAAWRNLLGSIWSDGLETRVIGWTQTSKGHEHRIAVYYTPEPQTIAAE